MGKKHVLTLLGVGISMYNAYNAYANDIATAAPDMKVNALIKHATGIIREPVRQGYTEDVKFDWTQPAMIYAPTLMGVAGTDYIGGRKGFNVNAKLGKLPFDLAL